MVYATVVGVDDGVKKSDPDENGFKRIFNHRLDTILSKDDNSLDRPTLVANVKNILSKIDTVKKKNM